MSACGAWGLMETAGEIRCIRRASPGRHAVMDAGAQCKKKGNAYGGEPMRPDTRARGSEWKNAAEAME